MSCTGHDVYRDILKIFSNPWYTHLINFAPDLQVVAALIWETQQFPKNAELLDSLVTCIGSQRLMTQFNPFPRSLIKPWRANRGDSLATITTSSILEVNLKKLRNDASESVFISPGTGLLITFCNSCRCQWFHLTANCDLQYPCDRQLCRVSERRCYATGVPVGISPHWSIVMP